MKTLWLLSGAAFLALALSACSDGGELAPPDDSASTWALIQENILDTDCTVCHSAGESDALTSSLVLTSDVAYEQLVGRAPKNPRAVSDGLKLVDGSGVGATQLSYLWEKVNWPQEQHYFDDHPEYGSLMPLGGPPLTNGQLTVLGLWIAAGAPRNGMVSGADEIALRNETRYTPGPFVPLDPPAPGEGYQLTMGSFEVQPGTEREVLQYAEFAPPGEDTYVIGYEVRMRQGSHHFIAHTFDDGIGILQPEIGDLRDLYGPDGAYYLSTVGQLLHHQFFVGSQTANDLQTFPPGIALRLPAGKGLDLDSHYVNRGTEVITGEVFVNLYTIPRERVEHVAETLFLNNIEFELPPSKQTTLERSFVWTGSEWRIGGSAQPGAVATANIYGLVSHSHEHNLEFHAYLVGGLRDGERVYSSYDWEHPPQAGFEEHIVIEPGQGIRCVAVYDNYTTRSLRFGTRSDNEMMILFGSYYVDETP